MGEFFKILKLIFLLLAETTAELMQPRDFEPNEVSAKTSLAIEAVSRIPSSVNEIDSMFAAGANQSAHFVRG